MNKLLTTTLLALAATTALAEYPEKPITIVVPFAAGGPTDKVARDFAEALRKPLGGATIATDNVGGAAWRERIDQRDCARRIGVLREDGLGCEGCNGRG